MGGNGKRRRRVRSVAERTTASNDGKGETETNSTNEKQRGAKDDQGNSDEAGGITRRKALKSASAAAITAAGFGATTGSASAGEIGDCADWESSPVDYPTVDLRSEYPDTWWGYDPDEVVIYAHGWNSMKKSDDQTYAVEQELNAAGYTEDVIAASWDSDTINFWGAESNADEAGVRLGRWIRDQFSGTSTTIHLVGHSLGGRLSLNTLAELGGDVELDTVAMLGAAVEDDSVCDDGRFADGIVSSATDVYNYHSREDSTVCTLYDFSTLASGVGCEGADCGGWFTSGSTPDNYHDVDVTADVPGHCEYFDPGSDAGCIDQVVDDFNRDDGGWSWSW